MAGGLLDAFTYVGHGHVFGTMQLALPAVLFLSIVNTPCSVLLGQGPLVGLLALGLLGLYAILLLALRFVARLTIQRSALFAPACTQPQFAFMGISILGGLFGPRQAAIPIAVAGILVNVVLAPVALVLMNLPNRSEATAERTRSAAPAAERVLVGATAGSAPSVAGGAPPVSGGAPPVPVASSTAATRKSTGGTVVRVLRRLPEPFAWAPLLGLVLALVGVHPFKIIAISLTLIGGAASAAALLFVGISVARAGRPRLSLEVWAIALASVVAQPLLTYGIGRLVTTGTIAAQAALIVAFPVTPVTMMLASRHGARNDQQIVASTVALSLVLSIGTL
ncbi:AEC family transporter, partial [Streptomyces sp. NPDC058272]|uniref:AEC family transporter n=1 Tax=Streptomyces sp. NPDC058272 TaxID=3346415 RepID=UPI0036E49832